MAKDPAAEKWFTGKAETISRRVTRVLIGLARKTASLMFNRGGIIPGRYPHMEGEGRAVRSMRFADLAEVNAGRRS